jgi:predicted ferric reductase
MPEQLETEQNATKAYDTLLIALAGGALALTVGFIKDVIDLRRASDKGYLFFSWSMFASALLLTLFNYYFTIDQLAKKAEEALKPEPDRKPVVSRYHPMRHHANTAYGSMLLFALGLLFFIWFLVENIPSAAVAHAAAAQ